MTEYLFVALEDERLTPLLNTASRLDPRLGRVQCDRLLLGELSQRGTFFDGIAVVGDVLVRTPEDADRVRGAGRGNYLLARHEDGRQVTIEIDPFGFYPLFVYHRDGVFCAASRVALLIEALGGIGRDLRRDLMVHGWFTAQGSGAFNISAVGEVSLLPRGTSIHIDQRNRVSYRHSTPAELFYADAPLSQLIDEAAAELVGNVRALARSEFRHRVCDLTGGMDSRLVLAAVMHEGLQDAFLFFTKGHHPNPDANVAALIRRQFGLRKAVNIFPPKPVPLSPLEKLRSSVGNVDGLLSTYFELGPEQPDLANQLSIGGGSGELLREFWSSGQEADEVRPWWRRWLPARTAADSRSALQRKMQAIQGRARFVRQDALDTMLAAIGRFAEESVAAGIRLEHVGDLFYLSSRAKYHFGVWWARSSRARFHPLYLPAALKAAHAMSNPEKAANRLGFELMRRLAPELLSIPFADKRWDTSLMPDAPPAITRASPFQGDPDEKTVSLYPGRRTKAAERTEWERRLIACGSKQRYVELGAMLREFHEIDPDFAALEPVFDASAVRAFLARPPEEFRGRYDTDDAYRLIGAYVWAQGLEITPPREELAATLS